jgi:hypothetical protein
MKTVKASILLREALQNSHEWEDVAEQLTLNGTSLAEVSACLKPVIGFDPHNHTLHSDGMFSYRQLVWWCKAVGMEAIGVTDHDNLNPLIADAIEEARRLGVRLIPGLEFTVNRLGGQLWKGLEVGLHFFPEQTFADFVRSPDGVRFCGRFEKLRLQKSAQAWEAMEAVNERFMVPHGLSPISRDELWQESGATDPVCASGLTCIMLRRFFTSGDQELQARFPDTRVVWAFLNREGFIPPISSGEQTLDGLIEIREELGQHGIRSTITLNHPEEWLSKCGLVLADGSPDRPAIRRLLALLLLHEPRRAPFSFMELYSARNTPQSRELFEEIFQEVTEVRERYLSSLSPLYAIASTDSHRVSGEIDAAGQVTGWVPGEDFIFGLGKIDAENPQGNLRVPQHYPSASQILALMESCAS